MRNSQGKALAPQLSEADGRGAMVRIARTTVELSDGYIADLHRKPVNMADVIAHAERHVRFLRQDAHFAYLDGRAARAKALNAEADRVGRAIRDAARPEKLCA